MKLILISGMSGAGKSIVLHTLEDCNFYCIDNLPIEFLGGLVERCVSGDTGYGDKIAVNIGVHRLQSAQTDLGSILAALKKHHIEENVLFIDAGTEVLLRRYNETRRPHPMADDDKNRTLEECIETERKMLDSMMSVANNVIDTSRLSPAQLREIVTRGFCRVEPVLNFVLQSFGYKKGLPVNSDYVFDVRCLPNPYWHAELRQFDGTDPRIAEFMEKDERCSEMVNSITGFISKWLASFTSATRNYLTVSIGCTGGQHRSVYVVEQVHRRLNRQPHSQKCRISKKHRDL